MKRELRPVSAKVLDIEVGFLLGDIYGCSECLVVEKQPQGSWFTIAIHDVRRRVAVPFLIQQIELPQKAGAIQLDPDV